MVTLALVIKALLEVAALIATGIGAYALFEPPMLKWLSAIAGPLAIAIIWAVLIAPQSTHKLDVPWRIALELLVFAVAGVAVWNLVSPVAASIFAAVVIADTFVLAASGQYV